MTAIVDVTRRPDQNGRAEPQAGAKSGFQRVPSEETLVAGSLASDAAWTAETGAPTVLIVDDEPRSIEAIGRILGDAYDIRAAASATAALAILETETIQVIISDQRMPDMTGVELLAIARSRWPEALRIIVTGFTDANDVIRAINEAGIYHFIAKPWHPDELLQTVRNAAELYRLQRDHERLSTELKLLRPAAVQRVGQFQKAVQANFHFDAIIRTPASPLNAVCQRAGQIAEFDLPVSITGETGTGKELLARAIHYASLRADRPFHALNCGAIPDELLESELFGHKKGAFTGAHTTRIGLLEQAHLGTIFLDEIGDISPAFQVKLLRFLQEREIRPVGSNETRRVDVRVISATHRNLEEETRAGRLRQDLFYRLAVTTVHLPSLAERRDDIPLLAQHILNEAMRVHGKRVAGFTAEAMAVLTRHDWPGNVRELQNEVVRMLVLARGDTLGPELISSGVLARAAATKVIPESDEGSGPLRERLDAVEARILQETLVRHRWNKSRAAQDLGLSRVGLRAKMARLGLEPDGTDEDPE